MMRDGQLIQSRLTPLSSACKSSRSLSIPSTSPDTVAFDGLLICIGHSDLSPAYFADTLMDSFSS